MFCYVYKILCNFSFTVYNFLESYPEDENQYYLIDHGLNGKVTFVDTLTCFILS